MQQYLIAATVIAACTTPALAAETEHREHGAHEHGSAELNLVWEGETVSIEFESPAVNIVGFEHAPRTYAQRETVRNAVASLKNAGDLFVFTPEARCVGQATEVESELAENKSAAHAKQGNNEHSAFRAQYRFTCKKPDALRSVKVNLLKRFPGTKTLRARIVSATNQSATELKPGHTRLTLP